MHPFFFSPSAKKKSKIFSRLRRYTVGPPTPRGGGGAIEFAVFCASALLPKKSILPTTTSKKIDFTYNNFPKKAISLRKCTKKKIAKKSKKKIAPAALYRWTPPGCYRISVFCASALLPLYLSLRGRAIRCFA